MGALYKAMEKQDDRLKIPEARLTSKTYTEDCNDEILWENLKYVLANCSRLYNNNDIKCNI